MKNEKFPLRLDKNADFDILIKTEYESFPIHWHSFFEFEYLSKGSCVHTLNGETRKIEEGTLIFLTPSDFHKFDLIDNRPVEIINIHFNEAYMTEETIGIIAGFPSGFYRADELIKREFELIAEFFSGTLRNKDKLIKNSMERIFLLLCRNCELKQDSGNNMLAALIYMENHFREDINLNDVACAAHYSPNYFSEKFHELYGKTLKAYITERRLKWAMGLLKNTSIPVGRICYEAGFNSHAHFTRCFKEFYGISPTEIRKA